MRTSPRTELPFWALTMAREDREYMEWLGAKSCATGCGRRSGPPHHPKHLPSGGGVGIALRAHDHRAVNLCHVCHDSVHKLTTGFFKGWVRQQVRDWLDALGEKLRAEYEQRNKE